MHIFCQKVKFRVAILFTGSKKKTTEVGKVVPLSLETADYIRGIPGLCDQTAFCRPLLVLEA